MKTKILIFLLSIALLFSKDVLSQVENVPLSDPVYDFLKEMRVKRIISDYFDDDPNLSRFQIAEMLKEISDKSNELSSTERSLAKRYMVEFVPEEMNERNTTSLLGGNLKTSTGFRDFFSDKEKYFYAYQKNDNNVFIQEFGHLYYINELKPDKKANAKLFGGGFRFRGTLFNKLGYYFNVEKGGGTGDTMLMESAFPPIRSNFKYVENIENIKNYDFAKGYLKLYIEPQEDMGLSIQLGREQIKYGVGYSDRIALSGDAPDMDFLKFKFDYGIIHYSSVFASTVGEFNRNPLDNYTKYFLANRLKLSFKNLFDIGIAETIISSRGFELAYLNPVIFYKFVEHSLQDRDNGTIFVDMQTHFLKNFEMQGTFFLDENILSNLSDMTKASNKSAYQLGFYWYEPANVKNLSLIFEYTKLRPYIYTHFNQKNNYAAFGVNMGHPIGPNADQIFTKLIYNVSEKVRVNFEYQKIRRGENIYDANGQLIKNVGGNIFDGFRVGTDSDTAIFLDGNRVNEDNVSFNIAYEPIRNFRFDLNYVYNISKNLTLGNKNDFSYGFARFTLGY